MSEHVLLLLKDGVGKVSCASALNLFDVLVEHLRQMAVQSYTVHQLRMQSFVMQFAVISVCVEARRDCRANPRLLSVLGALKV